MGYRILRLPEVKERTGLKKTAIFEHVRRGDFPAPIKITEKAIGWIEQDIDDFIERRIEASRQGREVA